MVLYRRKSRDSIESPRLLFHTTPTPPFLWKQLLLRCFYHLVFRETETADPKFGRWSWSRGVEHFSFRKGVWRGEVLLWWWVAPFFAAFCGRNRAISSDPFAQKMFAMIGQVLGWLYFIVWGFFCCAGVWCCLESFNRKVLPLPLPTWAKKILQFKTSKQISDEQKEEAKMRRNDKKDDAKAGEEAVILLRTIYKVFVANENVPNGNADLIVALIKQSIVAAPTALLRNLDLSDSGRGSSRGRSPSPSPLRRTSSNSNQVGLRQSSPRQTSAPAPAAAPAAIPAAAAPSVLRAGGGSLVRPMSLMEQLKGEMSKRREALGEDN